MERAILLAVNPTETPQRVDVGVERCQEIFAEPFFIPFVEFVSLDEIVSSRGSDPDCHLIMSRI